VANLQSYLTTTRFLLHDPNAVTFSDAQLTNCINLGRDAVISDTASPQAIVTIPLVSGQEAYSFNTILQGLQSLVGLQARAVQAILGVNFIQATTLKQPLAPLPWSTLNERYRLNPINSLPEAFAVLSLADTLYIEPAPSGSIWSAEIRCAYLGNNLVQYTDVEMVVPSPLAEALVPLQAAKWAQSFNDDEDSADKFEQKYERQLVKMAAAMPPYASAPYSSNY
jgi:hypothetical protein